MTHKGRARCRGLASDGAGWTRGASPHSKVRGRGRDPRPPTLRPSAFICGRSAHTTVKQIHIDMRRTAERGSGPPLIPNGTARVTPTASAANRVQGQDFRCRSFYGSLNNKTARRLNGELGGWRCSSLRTRQIGTL
ncbi:hypothetical protein EVAR_83250_1 [Eumeta japonica]|uniref:Uncharacterized protein n=1 Tax=Eumeta variegata TaxID=151549 RepID=A0A4C1Y529_EUMVA|nr:hypothetical protein EVAR_83250_1 [Eumeta japonica]